ncbi:MAG: class I SAM-dependent methyltransferase [Lachnospiraceae bacterium]|nr:class I SAM-dependent methyltransferase [Lachnospiraceae bacterium]
MELSNRLRIVAGEVSQGNRLADIGTDHGYIPIFLVKEGRIPSAIAMDVNDGPLKRAQKNIEKEGLSDRIITRKSDGLEALLKDEADTILIAGMGGALVTEILERGRSVLAEGKELILQPQSELFKVRHCLHRMSYRIIKEAALREDGKYYFIIKAVPGTEHYEEEYLYEYGKCLLEKKDSVMVEYLLSEKEKQEKVYRTLLSHKTEAARKRRKEVEAQLDKIKKAYCYEM